jgi:membrane associated rhomboid family serine protease
VFQGTRAACSERALVLEAQAIPCRLQPLGADWTLVTDLETAGRAQAELHLYAREAGLPQAPAPATFRAFPGAGYGAVAYAGVLLLVAHAAGAHWFGEDWFAAGAVDASEAARHEGWRCLTALTLHLGPEHLLGNLLFGLVAGGLCSGLVGPGVAWLSVALAGAAANGLEAWVAPVDHRAVGASTAVFAAFGLLTGYAWRQRAVFRERRGLYRFAPLIAGVSLLVFLGAGPEHVDVLGHVFGFCTGLGLGWTYALLRVPRSRRARVQVGAGSLALALICGAWWLALSH